MPSMSANIKLEAEQVGWGEDGGHVAELMGFLCLLQALEVAAGT